MKIQLTLNQLLYFFSFFRFLFLSCYQVLIISYGAATFEPWRYWWIQTNVCRAKVEKQIKIYYFSL